MDVHLFTDLRWSIFKFKTFLYTYCFFLRITSTSPLSFLPTKLTTNEIDCINVVPMKCVSKPFHFGNLAIQLTFQLTILDGSMVGIFSLENQFWISHWQQSIKYNSFERAHQIKLLMCLSCAFYLSRCLTYLLYKINIMVLCGLQSSSEWNDTSCALESLHRQFGYSAEKNIVRFDWHIWVAFFCCSAWRFFDSVSCFSPFNFHTHMHAEHTHIRLFEWFLVCAFFCCCCSSAIVVN